MIKNGLEWTSIGYLMRVALVPGGLMFESYSSLGSYSALQFVPCSIIEAKKFVEENGRS